MGQLRSELHTILLGITPHVYFQPPENVKIQYPCIVYARNQARNQYANNVPYHHTKRYQVTVIDTNPDSEIPDLVSALSMCEVTQHFTSDNLHHDVFNLYF